MWLWRADLSMDMTLKKIVSGGRAEVGVPTDSRSSSIGKPKTATCSEPRTDEVCVTALTMHLGATRQPLAASA